MRLELLVLGGLVVCAAGCSSPVGGGIVCTEQFVYGIGISAVDSVSGTPVTGASAIARDGAFADTTTTPGGLAGERAGTYSVTVTKTGYAVWTANGITVTRDVCHVHPVSVVAKLKPAP